MRIDETQLDLGKGMLVKGITIKLTDREARRFTDQLINHVGEKRQPSSLLERLTVEMANRYPDN